MVDSAIYILRTPGTDEEWVVYHSIRRRVLFESRGLFGVYDENRPEEFDEGIHPMILIYEGEPIGVIRIDVRGDTAWFRRIAVREDLQRAGHGKVLLALAEARARDEGCYEVRSNVAADAVGFYERCGFSIDSSNVATGDAVPMQKRIV